MNNKSNVKNSGSDKTNENPLVTFALIAFNQEQYIRDAIEGALAQTYSPLEIVFSDDSSSDRTFEIMREMASTYNGPHKIALNRNPKNLNIGEHVNTIGRISSGEIIVLAAGDDVSVPHRTEKLIQHWTTFGRPSAVLCSDFEAMDAGSAPIILKSEAVFRGEHSTQEMARGNVRVLGATSAITKDVFTAFPPMDPSVRHEDRVLPFRAMLLGGVVTLVNEKLVRYRVEGGISRTQPKSAHDYLYVFSPAQAARTLPDALQRFRDLETNSPRNIALKKTCLTTIADHRAQIEMAKSRSLEASLVKWILKGARTTPLIKVYLKMRLMWVFSPYFRMRHEKGTN